MKKYILVIAAIAVIGTITIAKANPEGEPFKAIWDAINNLQEQINNILLIPRWDEERVTTIENNFSDLNTQVDQLEERVSQLEDYLTVSLFEHYNSGDDNVQSFHGLVWEAQSFTPATTHKITKVKLKIYRVGLPGLVTISIKATDGEGEPTGSDLASGTIDGNTLTTDSNGAWYEINLGAGATLSSGIKYAIVTRAVGPDASNRVSWRTDASSPTYGGGQSLTSVDGGSVWDLYDYDNMFEEWGI